MRSQWYSVLIIVFLVLFTVSVGAEVIFYEAPVLSGSVLPYKSGHVPIKGEIDTGEKTPQELPPPETQHEREAFEASALGVLFPWCDNQISKMRQGS